MKGDEGTATEEPAAGGGVEAAEERADEGATE
jgi:hypothetical protein